MHDWLKTSSLVMLVAAAAVVLSACGGGGSSGMSSGSSGSTTGSQTGTGTMSVMMTDAPACGFDAVNVTVQQVRIHQSSMAAPTDAGWTNIPVMNPQPIDLLTLTNGILETLGTAPVPAGHYQQMRLVLASNDSMNPLANSVVPAGMTTAVPLDTPSGTQSGIKMDVDFTVMANQMADFVIDFNACQSVVTAGNSGKFLLKPVLTVTPMLVSGVQGFVDSSLANGNTMVTLQDGMGTILKATVPDSMGKFLLQPVAPSTYVLVITAPNRATAVVTGVTVMADTVTSVNAPGNPITLPASLTATLTGMVTVTPTPPSIDATVAALQSLSDGETIDVASMGVDSMTGDYSLMLPVAAPMVAMFAAPPAMLSFAPDTGMNMGTGTNMGMGMAMSTGMSMSVAGTYTLMATLGGATKMVGPIMLTSGAIVMTDFAFP